MRDWAASIRRRAIQALAEYPKVHLKVRQKWLVLMSANEARSLMRIGAARLASMCVVTRCACHGLSPFCVIGSTTVIVCERVTRTAAPLPGEARGFGAISENTKGARSNH